MSVDLLADESVDGRLIHGLRLAGLRMASVREDNPGLPDREVLSLARRLNSVVLTEDSDFGDWVFAHQEPTLGVVFLRYRHNQRDLVSSVVLDLVRRHGSGLYGKFVTVTAKKIRVRKI